jgi:hypothetical protein
MARVMHPLRRAPKVCTRPFDSHRINRTNGNVSNKDETDKSIKYYYRVSAYNANGNSAYTATAYATTPTK